MDISSCYWYLACIVAKGLLLPQWNLLKLKFKVNPGYCYLLGKHCHQQSGKKMISSSEVGSIFLVLWEDIGIFIFGFGQFLVQFNFLHITTVFFRFLSTIMSVQDILRFFWICQGFQFPIVTLELQFQALYSDVLTEEYMTSLVSLAAVIWVVTATKQTVKS